MKNRNPTKSEVEAFLMTLPGKRGIDIPADIFDRIAPVAHGISRQVWGSPAMPQQLQDLHDGGFHTPDAIHEAYGSLPHPHAPSVTVGEYPQYSKAFQMFQDHQGDQRAGRQ